MKVTLTYIDLLFFVIISQLMDQLKEYKRIIKIHCLSIAQGSNPCFTFQIKFEQLNPHSLFKYEIVKSRDEVMRLFERLEGDIFDFDNPFNSNFLKNLTKPAMKPLEQLNAALEECTQRLDILIHHHFLYFFSVHVHYPDFKACLTEEMLSLHLCQNKKEIPSKQPTSFKQGFDLEKGWGTSKAVVKEVVEPEKVSNKPIKQASEFESLINLLHQEEDHRIQTQEKTVLDFICIKHFDNSFLIILEEQKKGTKLKSFIKTFFNDSRPSGYLSIHKKEGNHFTRKFTTNLEAEPLSMEHNTKTNMIMTLTTVGVYVHLIKTERENEGIEMFAFIPLVGVADITNNCFFGQVYLVRKAHPYKLYVFGLKDEVLRETEYKYKNASSICFEEVNNRLYVSDETGIYIYFVNGGVDIKRLHFLKTDESYINLSTKLGYLYCVNTRGVLTVVQLKPAQKEQLMSVTTSISIPSNTRKIVGSRSQRVIISCFRDCIVLIDTMEGPINSFKLKGHANIKALFYSTESQKLYAMTENGVLTILTLNKRIQ